MRIGKLIAATALGLSIFTSTTFAAPAWQLPTEGKVFESDAKQIYISQEMGKFFKGQVEMKFSAPNGWKYEQFEVKGVKTERLINPKQKKSKRVVLQLHGGGYIGALSDWYRDLAVKQAVLTDAMEVYMVDYRLAPENTYPAALEDAAQVYVEILKNHLADNVIIFGDSAGGNLALELALYLKENRLPQPAMLILVSPWTTFENNLPSRDTNFKKDLVLGEPNPYMYGEVANPHYGGQMSLKDPRLSPIYADLSGLPPTLIQIGGYELFVDEGIELLKRATADNLNVTLSVYNGMPHDFAMLLPDLQESVDSFAEIKNFVNVHMQK